MGVLGPGGLGTKPRGLQHAAVAVERRDVLDMRQGLGLVASLVRMLGAPPGGGSRGRGGTHLSMTARTSMSFSRPPSPPFCCLAMAARSSCRGMGGGGGRGGRMAGWARTASLEVCRLRVPGACCQRAHYSARKSPAGPWAFSDELPMDPSIHAACLPPAYLSLLTCRSHMLLMLHAQCAMRHAAAPNCAQQQHCAQHPRARTTTAVTQARRIRPPTHPPAAACSRRPQPNKA